MKVLCVTLGCKLNFYESCALAEAMELRGYQVVRDGDADVVIVNTCAVTSKAGMQSRQEVRKAIRNNPGAQVVMTGCYAQFNPGIVNDIEGLAAVVGNAEKASIPQWIADHQHPRQAIMPPENFGFSGFMPAGALRAGSFMGRSRAMLKIQDGCDSFCHYCIIPFLRGPSRSVDPGEVMCEAGKIAASGYREVMLTGVHIGLYGRDLQPEQDLVSLLGQLLRKTSMRVRLGSLQPQEVTPAMIELLADEENNLCEHLHLSLQSVDDQVLKDMGRPYGQNEIISLVKTVKRLNPRITIGADIIVGYPTESEGAFRNTLQVLTDLPLTYLHVFPYSPRPGTRAARLKDAVPATVKKERVKILRDLYRQKKSNVYRQYLKKKLRVVVEDEKQGENGSHSFSGHSRNYLEVSIDDVGWPEAAGLVGQEFEVMVHDYDGRTLLASIDR